VIARHQSQRPSALREVARLSEDLLDPVPPGFERFDRSFDFPPNETPSSQGLLHALLKEGAVSFCTTDLPCASPALPFSSRFADL
jgi:predicted phosphohydrolase